MLIHYKCECAIFHECLLRYNQEECIFVMAAIIFWASLYNKGMPSKHLKISLEIVM